MIHSNARHLFIDRDVGGGGEMDEEVMEGGEEVGFGYVYHSCVVDDLVAFMNNFALNID